MDVSTLARWHDVVARRDAGGLEALLADDVTFHSPVVHTPQVGKAVVTRYLTSALAVLASPGFRYVREIEGPHDAMLEFVVEVEGITVNGVDLIRWNDEQRIVDFKVMLRPLKAIALVQQKMAALLQASR